MEIHPEYIRDMHNHYMILKGNSEDKSNYTAKMLMNNSVPGILQTELRYLDSLDLYYYDITSKKTLKSTYEGKFLDYLTTKNIIKDILQIIENSQEYLLIEHDFIILPEFIFLDNSHQVGLCYMPGFSNNILEQLSYFFEYIMNKIDYKDESAVRLIYALYKESKNVESTFYKLYEIINYPDTLQEDEKKGSMEEESLESSSSDLFLTKQNARGSNNSNELLKKEKIIGKDKWDNKVNTKSNNKKNNKNNYKNNNSNNNNNKPINTGKSLLHSIKLSLHFIDKASIREGKSSSGNKSSNRENASKTNLSKSLRSEMNPTSTSKNNKMDLENYHIKVEADKSEVVNEREILYFGQLSYILAGSSIVVGIILLLMVYFSGIVSNTLGSGVDSVKLFACILMITCVEIYIMTKIFDPNKRLTKMEAVLEYRKEEEGKNNINFVDINQEGYSIFGDNLANSQNLKESNKELKEEKTQILWSDNSSSGEEKTQLLTYLEKPKYYYLTPIKAKAVTTEKITKAKVSEYPFYIGKNTNLSNMVIEDKSISRRHGVITCMEGKILYTDLDSTNGTFINGNKLEGNKSYTLYPFDEISFANIKYLWEELEED